MKLTIRQVFFIVLFLCLFLMTLRPIADPDFWWHLRTGQFILQTHAIPHIDPFSYTKAGQPWITHEWLSELLIYALFRLGSYGLLIFTFSIIITAAFLLTYLRSPVSDAALYCRICAAPGRHLYRTHLGRTSTNDFTSSCQPVFIFT